MSFTIPASRFQACVPFLFKSRCYSVKSFSKKRNTRLEDRGRQSIDGASRTGEILRTDVHIRDFRSPLSAGYQSVDLSEKLRGGADFDGASNSHRHPVFRAKRNLLTSMNLGKCSRTEPKVFLARWHEIVPRVENKVTLCTSEMYSPTLPTKMSSIY